MQNKFLILLFLFLVNSFSFGQDTIFTTRNPEGILVKKWSVSTINTYTLYPIDNSTQPIKCPSKQLKSIAYADGSVEENQRFKVYNDIVLRYNNRTGKIELKDSISIHTITEDEVHSYIQDFVTYNENIQFKKIEGSSNAQYIGRYTLYYDRGLFNVYFILRFDVHGQQLIHTQSNFVMIREKLNYTWLTENEILNLKKHVFKIEDFYYYRRQGYKPVFWQPLEENMRFIDAEIKRFTLPKEKMNPTDTLPNVYQTIVLSDSMILIDGTIFRCKVDSINETTINYYRKVKRRIVYENSPVKNVYRTYKLYEKPVVYSHKHAKKEGEYMIMDKSSFFFDFLIGSTSMFGLQRKYDASKGEYYHIGLSKGPSLTIKGKFGFKKYFTVQTLRYTPGFQFFLQPKLFFGNFKGGEISLFLGYTSVFQTKKKNQAIEFNTNVGFGSMFFSGASKNLLLVFGSDTRPSVILNPAIKYRFNRLAIGASYSWSNGIDIDPNAGYTKLQVHSVLLSLGRTF